MPTYVYRCPDYHITEKVTNLAGHARNVPCGTCEKEARQVLTAPRLVYVDNMPSYECPVTGQHVTTRHQRNEIMKQNDMVEAGDSKGLHV